MGEVGRDQPACEMDPDTEGMDRGPVSWLLSFSSVAAVFATEPAVWVAKSLLPLGLQPRRACSVPVPTI